MQTKAIIGATMLMLAASAVPVGAYHISTMVANTWTVGIPFLIICESDGPLDPRNPQPSARGGNGGLCTSGLNNVNCPVVFGCTPTSAPPTTAWTAFDLKDGRGSKNTVGYDVEIGVTTCSVAPTQEVRYRELYAWWNYDDAAGGPGFHGHVAAFVDLSTTTPGVSTGEGFVNSGTAGAFSCGSTDPVAHTPVHLT